jgi:hypothetical protein
MTWPEAVVNVTWIAGLAVVLSVLVWSIFRTGRTAISNEPPREIERLRKEVSELQAGLREGGSAA